MSNAGVRIAGVRIAGVRMPECALPEYALPEYVCRSTHYRSTHYRSTYAGVRITGTLRTMANDKRIFRGVFLLALIRMPCACRHPPVNVPDNMEWGPVFWSLLHGLAEKAGSAPMPGLQGDEIRAWKVILTTLGKTLPCEHCREHFSTYVLSNPVNIPDNYSDIRGWIRRWLLDLHNDVNKRLGKASYLYEDLTTNYHAVPLRQTWDILNVLMKRSIQGVALPILSWTKWSIQVKTLFGMYI